VTIPIKSRKDFSYFSETQSRIIVSVSPDKKDEFQNILHAAMHPCIHLGVVGGSTLKINDDIKVMISELSEIYFNTIPRIMSGEK